MAVNAADLLEDVQSPVPGVFCKLEPLVPRTDLAWVRKMGRSASAAELQRRLAEIAKDGAVAQELRAILAAPTPVPSARPKARAKRKARSKPKPPSKKDSTRKLPGGARLHSRHHTPRGSGSCFPRGGRLSDDSSARAGPRHRGLSPAFTAGCARRPGPARGICGDSQRAQSAHVQANSGVVPPGS